MEQVYWKYVLQAQLTNCKIIMLETVIGRGCFQAV